MTESRLSGPTTNVFGGSSEQVDPGKVAASPRATRHAQSGLGIISAQPRAPSVRAVLAGVRLVPGRWALLASGFAAPLVLGLFTVLVFWHGIAHGLAYYGSDTEAFYYPLTSWYAGQLRSGTLPLWLPYIFGGYPLFADGEIGMLYPLHVLAYALLPADVAFVWLRPLHFWLAGVFTFWFGRLLGLSRFGALIAGLTFSYSSFLVSHLQHENLVRSTIWLPLALGLLELALRAEGRRRLGWLVCCGAVLGIQMLGVHVQPVLFTLLALAGYALVGPLGVVDHRPATIDDRRPMIATAQRRLTSGRSLLGIHAGQPVVGGRWSPVGHARSVASYVLKRLFAVSLVIAVGLGLAAVQLLPLYEVGLRSIRAGEVSYEFSTSYSVPPMQLLQLLLPYFFRGQQGTYWGLWPDAETAIYLGVVPLMLSLVALAYLRNRAVLFFGVLAVLGLLVALGDYAPVQLYSLIWSLPGFSFMRAPARFSLFFILAGALLAGFALDWLASTALDRGARRRIERPDWRLLLLAAAFITAALGITVAFIVARAWIDENPDGARHAIETSFLTLRRGDWRLSSSTVYFGLLSALDLSNPRTLGAILLIVLGSTWLLLRGFRLITAEVWRAGVLALVALDLAVFAHSFYPQKSVADLKLSSPVVQSLGGVSGLHRIFVEPALNDDLGPNQLVPWSIDLAGGYSSLEPRRATDYYWSIVQQDDILLDLYGVRYVASPTHVPGLHSFEGTLYHPSDRLMHGAVGNPSGFERFEFGPWWTEALTIVASGELLRNVEYGQPLAEIMLRGPTAERRLILRAGQHVEDGAAPLLGPRLGDADLGPGVAWTGPLFRNPFQLSTLYGSTLRLHEPLLATTLSVQRVGPNVALDIYGLGLHDRAGLPIRSLMPSDKAKYRQVYQDDRVTLLQNTAAMPRAFLAPSARVAGGSRPVVEQLSMGSFDPRRTILLDGTSGEPLGPGRPTDEVGTAAVLEHGSTRVVVRAEAQRSGYLLLADRYDDDWRAWVDGRPVPLSRANAMFRAVPVESGVHEVIFSYEPLSVRLGALVSLTTLILLACFAFGTFRALPRSDEA
jgi:hypothetical protein